MRTAMSIRAAIARLVGGLRAGWHPDRTGRDLDDEIRAYADEAIDARGRAGQTADDARRAVRAEMGSAESVKDRVRDVGWEVRLEGVAKDVRYAVRTLRRSPAFTAAAVLTLSIAIGATAAIFSLVDAVILKSLPVTRPEALVLVGGSGLQYPVFQALGRHTDVFVDLCATSGVRPLDVAIDAGARERAAVSLVSGSYFATLGVGATLGRTLTPGDDRAPGAHAVAVLSYGYW